MAAYDAYLQGRNHLFRTFATFQPAHAERSVQALREAIRRDSSFAEAHAWLGLAYASRPPVAGTAGPWLDSASAAIERARKIEPDLPAAHLAQARIYRYLGPDSIPAVITSLRRALELQPNHALAKSALSDALAADGQYAEALQLAREAVQLDPRNPEVLQEMADHLRAAGFYEEAKAWYRSLLGIEPDHLPGVGGLADTQLLRGRPDQALQTWERFLERQDPPYIQHAMVGAAAAALAADRPERAKDYLERPVEGLSASPGGVVLNERRPRFRALHGLSEFRLGNRGRGRQFLQETADFIRPRLQRDTPFYVPTLFTLAGTQAALGRPDRALEHLKQMRGAAGGWYLGILTSPRLDDLRSDPRFEEMVRVMEAEREKIREEVRQLGIDLYPPGAEPYSAGQAESASK